MGNSQTVFRTTSLLRHQSGLSQNNYWNKFKLFGRVKVTNKNLSNTSEHPNFNQDEINSMIDKLKGKTYLAPSKQGGYAFITILIVGIVTLVAVTVENSRLEERLAVNKAKKSIEASSNMTRTSVESYYFQDQLRPRVEKDFRR